MKRLLLNFLIPVLALTLSTGIMATNKKRSPVLVKHVFGVHGLSCAFCVIGLKRTFKKVKRVHSIAVSLKHGTVTVYTKKGVCFSKKELKRLFGKAGFTYHGTLVQPKSCGKIYSPRLAAEPTCDGVFKGEPRAPLWSTSVRTGEAQSKFKWGINNLGACPGVVYLS